MDRPATSTVSVKQLWEARAVALMSQPHVWNAVESLVYDLQMSEGAMSRAELAASINRGVEMPS
jgi:hypothetical protein